MESVELSGMHSNSSSSTESALSGQSLRWELSHEDGFHNAKSSWSFLASLLYMVNTINAAMSV